jgi:hypothetical protein
MNIILERSRGAPQILLFTGRVYINCIEREKETILIGETKMNMQECMMFKAAKKKTLWNPIKGQRRKIYILVDGVMQEYRKPGKTGRKNYQQSKD